MKCQCGHEKNSHRLMIIDNAPRFIECGIAPCYCSYYKEDAPSPAKDGGPSECDEWKFRVPKEGDRYYFDNINYIFEKEKDGNSRMICEVRGEGDKKFYENGRLLVEALNGQGEVAKLQAEVERLKAALNVVSKRAGKWMSAALDDDEVTDEMKMDFIDALGAIHEVFKETTP